MPEVITRSCKCHNTLTVICGASSSRHPTSQWDAPPVIASVAPLSRVRKPHRAISKINCEVLFARNLNHTGSAVQRLPQTALGRETTSAWFLGRATSLEMSDGSVSLADPSLPLRHDLRCSGRKTTSTPSSSLDASLWQTETCGPECQSIRIFLSARRTSFSHQMCNPLFLTPRIS
jgi:hypothetical protein